MSASRNTSPTNRFFLALLIFIFHAVTISAQNDITNIGAIINEDSRIGKEEKTAMEVAIQTFNNMHKLKLVPHVNNSGGDPLQASTAADYLIKEKHVQIIIGMETWEEASLVSLIGNRAQVPIISFSAPSIVPPRASERWPFLVTMSSNNSLQMECVASIVGSYGWRKVIAIYEEDSYNTGAGTLQVFLERLQAVGSEVEHWLVFPPFPNLSNPKSYVKDELEKLISKENRVFIIIGSSLELASYILTEAKDIGLMGSDSVWITADSVARLLLDTNDSNVMSSMEGIIGIETYISKTNPSFKEFNKNFGKLFRSNYPKEANTEPGIYALRAYDAIHTIASAVEKSQKNMSLLLGNILSSNFSGLSGEIHFQNRTLSSSTTYEIVNVFQKNYISLKFWSQNYGFSDKFIAASRGVGNRTMEGVKVHWPGGLEHRNPVGWVNKGLFIIGVPADVPFKTFVNAQDMENLTGFSIDVFNKSVALLGYSFPYKFKNFSYSYQDLVDLVYNKVSNNLCDLHN